MSVKIHSERISRCFFPVLAAADLTSFLNLAGWLLNPLNSTEVAAEKVQGITHRWALKG